MFPKKGQNVPFFVKETPNKPFLGPYVGFLFFAPNFAMRQF